MNNKIPKTIHYCWFGGNPLPELAIKCIASWKKYLPDYEIKQWDESNFDINACAYVAEAYKAKKYAFVSDYARFKILHDEGGIYFDTDVELINSIDDIVEQGAFMGFEGPITVVDGISYSARVAPGLGIGATAGMPFYKELLDIYRNSHFIVEGGEQNLKTVVDFTSEALSRHGILDENKICHIEGISIYPPDFFCALSPELILNITPNSRSIHHYSASWQSPMFRLRKRVKRMFGSSVIRYIQPMIMKFRNRFLD